ncbi:hypothetical protein JCM14036_02740 [Desulfotomaculum defluvii]
MSFEKRFFEFASDRCDHDAFRVLVKNEEYRDATNDAGTLFNKIVELLGPEHKDLVMAYESASGMVNTFELHQAYVVGLNDGLALKAKLDSVAS